MGVTPPLAWASASRPFGGAGESGDGCLVAPTATGALVAVVDGLGHGSGAAAAAGEAIATLRLHLGEPITALMERCHEALRSTRGAAVTLAAIDTRARTLSWLAVGNVEAVLWPGPAALNGASRRRRIATRAGVVGFNLPPLRATEVPMDPGALMVLATDGVRAEFAHERPSGSPQQAAPDLLRRFGTLGDDALVLAATYQEGDT